MQDCKIQGKTPFVNTSNTTTDSIKTNNYNNKTASSIFSSNNILINRYDSASLNETCLQAENMTLEERYDDKTVEYLEQEAKTMSNLYEIIVGGLVDLFDGDTKDGVITGNEQGWTGDCYLLSAINALSYTKIGAQTIKQALDYQDNDTTIVHLATGDVVVTDEEVFNTKAYFDYSSGDDDMIIFELAVEKVLKQIANGEIEVPDDFKYYDGTVTDGDINGGNSDLVIYMLTGKISKFATQEFNKDWQLDDALDYFEQNQRGDFVLTTSLTNHNPDEGDKITVEDVNGKEIDFSLDHAYAIKSVDHSSVTVINPWDSDEEIVLSRENFKEHFGCGLVYTDLSRSGNYDRWVKQRDESRELINNTQYYYEYEYDENGDTTKKRVQTRDGAAGLEYTYDKDGNEKVRLYNIDKDGNITVTNNVVTPEQAQKLIERGILDLTDDYSTGTGLSMDISCSHVADIDDEKWEILKDLLNDTNCSKDRINLQNIGRLAFLDKEDMTKAFYTILGNENADPEIVFRYYAGMISEEEFQEHLDR